MMYKIRGSPDHTLDATLPRIRVPARLTRQAVSVHCRYRDVPGVVQSNLVGRLFLRVCSYGILRVSPALLVME